MHCFWSFSIIVLSWLWSWVASALDLPRSIELQLGFISAVCLVPEKPTALLPFWLLSWRSYYWCKIFESHCSAVNQNGCLFVLRILFSCSLWQLPSLGPDWCPLCCGWCWELNPLLGSKSAFLLWVWIGKDPHLQLHDISWVTPLSISPAANTLKHAMPKISCPCVCKQNCNILQNIGIGLILSFSSVDSFSCLDNTLNSLHTSGLP